MKINEIIKARRQELGLTLKDIASALNIAESTVSRYETSNIQNMGIDKIEALAKVLQCSPGYLLGWQDTPPAEKQYFPDTLAAHFEGEDYTKEELEEIRQFAAFVKSKREKK